MVIDDLIREYGLTSEPQLCFDGEFYARGDNKGKSFGELVDEEVIEGAGEILIIDANRKNPL